MLIFELFHDYIKIHLDNNDEENEVSENQIDRISL